LIIDLTDNGGGSICFGQTLLAYLQGDLPESQNWGPQDLPCSPLQVNLTLSAGTSKIAQLPPPPPARSLATVGAV